MLNVLALIPFPAPPNALIGLLDDEPKELNEAGANEAGEKALLRPEPGDIAAIAGDIADMALIGFENDMPGKPAKPAGPKLSLFHGGGWKKTQAAKLVVGRIA